jgi:hypothetical protein
MTMFGGHSSSPPHPAEQWKEQQQKAYTGFVQISKFKSFLNQKKQREKFVLTQKSGTQYFCFLIIVN